MGIIARSNSSQRFVQRIVQIEFCKEVEIKQKKEVARDPSLFTLSPSL